MRSQLRLVPVVLLLASAVLLLAPRRGQSVPLYAARTGLRCGTCHFDPNGGGPRNEFGFAYGKNRHELTPEAEPSPWANLALVNRVGDQMPLYFGANQRVMLLANSSLSSDSLDRIGFFNMENAIHFAFQPHDRLTLVYTHDVAGFAVGQQPVQAREAYGNFTGLGWDGYLRVGRFRPPFGLRMDDHTVATRNSFLDFQTQERFLPYDPRGVDTGVEYGMGKGAFWGQAAWMNGNANVFQGHYAGATAVKLGANVPGYQGALSVYDDYRKETFSHRRVTRWGYYGMTHWRQFALLGEVAAGTDEAQSGDKQNSLAYWAELDWTANRWANLRLRYDHLELNRANDQALADLNTFDRYAVEGEFQPVPFGQVRWVYRLVDPKAEDDGFGNEIPDEKQMYVQLHFSY